MWGYEVLSAVVEFVVFDNYEASNCSQDGYVVEGRMGVCSLRLLLGCVGGLEDEDALDKEEH